ncbi:NAD(P)-binding protein [Cryphonectria parasitica EP155]|uniref:NAD(P)-binding protein n=1 Tax=Cryphonectria parasitica (strain ATCC 38755 / EP155) TaxID=660469 RepID=A0A9P4XZ75_CRYP1|nr:NAD(P)-binding protein [Cryphonectria parasitica EP155]KAF3763616.1 NAD(P)-binding protein [Cryphonectria parasitica EP155]
MSTATTKNVGDFPIANKILLITGGGSGIGLALARQFHARGGRVLLGDLKLTPAAEQFLHTTEVDRPGSAVFRRCDVTRWQGESSLHALISASVLEFGDVPDVYCPCAGIFEPPWSNFWDDEEGQDDDGGRVGGYAAVRINTEHPIKLTRLAFRALVGAEKKGVVLLVASGAGLAGAYDCALYCATKHAVVGLCKSLAQADPDEGIKVVCICPNLVKTPLWEEREDDRAKYYHYDEESTRKNTPDEVAEAMMRLVEEGRFSGGTVYVKSPQREEVVFEGGQASRFETSYPRAVLDKERGKPWNVDL